jgi:hypothetical protein
MGDRIDSGTSFVNIDLDGKGDFGLYLPFGGINWQIESGSRSDFIPAVAAVYVRTANAGNSWTFNDMELSNGFFVAASSMLIDGQSCEGGTARINLNNVGFEVDASMTPTSAPIKINACPTENYPQVYLNINGGGVSCGNNAAYFNCPSIMVWPPSSGRGALNLHNNTALFPTATSISLPFSGIPTLNRGNLIGTIGYSGLLDYSPPFQSMGTQQPYAAPPQALTDYNFNQLWQHGIHASAFMNTDPAFAALANATTLYVGQIVAPPVNWSAVVPNLRYGLQVVYQAGTTGTPNYGLTNCISSGSVQLQCSGTQSTITATSCSANSLTVSVSSNVPSANQVVYLTGTAESVLNNGAFTVASATGSGFSVPYNCNGFTGNASDTGIVVTSSTVDLEAGQFISIGSVSGAMIESMDASNPTAVLVNINTSTAAIVSPTALNYSAPVLGPEMQLPTKRSSAPTSLAWLEGDTVQNSGAAANGIASYVNVAAGTPGTWAGVPLGDSTGKINGSQINGYVAPITNIGVAVGTTTIPANGCLPTNTTYYTASMVGVTSASTFTFTPNASVASITGWTPAGPIPYFNAYPTANTLNWQICNNSTPGITPGSTTTWNVSAH